MSEPTPSDPTPSGPKDAVVADPPSTEAAESDHKPHLTPGLGNALAEPTSESEET